MTLTPECVALQAPGKHRTLSLADKQIIPFCAASADAEMESIPYISNASLRGRAKIAVALRDRRLVNLSARLAEFVAPARSRGLGAAS